MRRAWIVTAVLVVGCQGLEQPNAHWMQQINSANEIPDLDIRGGTLERVVESASYTGDVVAARYALAQLGNGPQRDELAARCVLLLASHSPEKGREFAEEIDDATLQNETLVKLDEGGKEEQPATVEPGLSPPANSDATSESKPTQDDDSQTDPGGPVGGR